LRPSSELELHRADCHLEARYNLSMQNPPEVAAWDFYERRNRGESLERDKNAESENGVAWALVPWDIRNESRAWTSEEIETRFMRMLMEIKEELSDGKLYFYDGTRMMVLGLLLENQGLDKAVQFGNIEDWERALEKRKRSLL
jgi:hypothetical protein